MLAQPRLARRPLRAAAVAEDRLEDRPRVPLHRERLRRAAPRDRVRVDAAQVAGAGAGVVRPVHRHLERGNLRLPCEVAGEELVHRDVRDDLDLVATAPRRPGQERAGGAGVDVVPARAQSRQHDGLVAVRGERLQDRRQLEARSLGLRRPVLHRHAVRDVERLEPVRRLAHRARRGRHRGRRHRVEQRQRERRAEPPEYGPPRQRLVHEGHLGPLLVFILSPDQSHPDAGRLTARRPPDGSRPPPCPLRRAW